MKQFAFETILDASFRQHERKFEKFMELHAATYRVNAELIQPDLALRRDVFARLAFAILSANAPFDESVKALDFVLAHAGYVDAKRIAGWKMVPAKARYVNQLWDSMPWTEYTKLEDETWSEYRYRLQSLVKGLGLAKASFAACLLYPLEADLACVDTWMQKVFLGNTSFKQLSKAVYEQVEAKIRVYARRYRVSTFLAQWMIWDHARGGRINSHSIFPGSHKESEAGNG